MAEMVDVASPDTETCCILFPGGLLVNKKEQCSQDGGPKTLQQEQDGSPKTLLQQEQDGQTTPKRSGPPKTLAQIGRWS